MSISNSLRRIDRKWGNYCKIHATKRQGTLMTRTRVYTNRTVRAQGGKNVTGFQCTREKGLEQHPENVYQPICGTNKGKNKSSPLRPIISFKARVADESKHYFHANDVNRVNCVVCPIMALQRLTNIVRLVDPRNFFQTSTLAVRGTTILGFDPRESSLSLPRKENRALTKIHLAISRTIIPRI